MPDRRADERPTTRLAGGVVRAAVLADVPELLRLVRELAAYEKEPDAVEATVENYRAILFPATGDPTGFCEVAEVDGRLVGMAFWYVTFSTWSGHRGIWLEDFFVEPEHRGAGLGHALFARLARICVLRGYRRLEWWVLDWNQDAIDFYESRGASPLAEWTHFRVDGSELELLGPPPGDARDGDDRWIQAQPEARLTDRGGWADREEAEVAGVEEIRVQVMVPREVPLGGPRAMRVRRTLPARERSLIGAWCFVDHYGPDDVARTGGMSVAPHPHTGLQTVSWLFEGEIEHRDSAGNHAGVRPGELNLMTAGRGISHSEVSTPATRLLHGVQLWVALPESQRHAEPGFVHHAPRPLRGPGWTVRVFLGSLLGSTSPVSTATPLLGAEIRLEAGAELALTVDPGFEHGVLVDEGVLRINPVHDDSTGIDAGEVPRHCLGYVAPGAGHLTLTAPHRPARVLLLGGEPFDEEIVMWWNFVGRSHEEIVEFREHWQAQLTRDGSPVTDSQQLAPGRFGVVVGDHLPPIPAPALPGVRLRPRR